MLKFIKNTLVSLLALLLLPVALAKGVDNNNQVPVVCAIPQVYNALESIKETSKECFITYYNTSTDLYAAISNNTVKCDILLSSDERLPILLIRSQKAEPVSMLPLMRAPLILWSKNPSLFAKDTKAITKKKIKSIALANSALTPVGFATFQIVSNKGFPTDYLKHQTFRGDHEYQVFSMVNSENVQTGFITRPLIYDKYQNTIGSYWTVPREYHADINYYLTILNDGKEKHNVINLYRYLHENDIATTAFELYGFEFLDTAFDKGEQKLSTFR